MATKRDEKGQLNFSWGWILAFIMLIVLVLVLTGHL